MFHRAHVNKPLHEHEPAAAATAAAHASTTGSALSCPLLVVTGISAMRDAEPTTSTSTTTTTAAHTTQVLLRTTYADASETANMTIRHDANNGNGHNNGGASSLTAGNRTGDPTDAITSPVLIGRGSGHRVKPFSGINDAAHHQNAAQMTRSLTSQQDLLDQRRSSFCSMSADGRAQLRRRSHDNMDFTSMSLPPPGSGVGFLQTRSKNHVHMRVYGRMDLETKRLTARQEEGAALVDVVIPSTRTIWRRGQPVCIEWRVLDEKVDTVQIELMEEGSSATTTIARAAPNSGFYMYPRVPWGMQCGPTYFLRISSTTDPTRYMTTSFFQIGSAP